MSSPAQRIQDSLTRALTLPRRRGSVDPRDADRMTALTERIASSLPDHSVFATPRGRSHTESALDEAARAYREGDHARAAAWLDHAAALLEANVIPGSQPAWELVTHLAGANRTRLAARDTSPTAPDVDSTVAALRRLQTLLTDYEATASILRNLPATHAVRDALTPAQADRAAELREHLEAYPDHLLVDALRARMRAAAQVAGEPLHDSDVDAPGAYGATDDDERRHAALQDAVDDAAYWARLHAMADHGVGQGSDPGWVTPETVFTERHLRSALATIEGALTEAAGDEARISLHANRDHIAHALHQLQTESRTTTSLRSDYAAPIPPLTAEVASLGLRALIGHYEHQRAGVALSRGTDQGALRLRSCIDDYVAAHALHDSPLVADLLARDWAATHATALLHEWHRVVSGLPHLAADVDLDAGRAQMDQIHTVRAHFPLLSRIVIDARPNVPVAGPVAPVSNDEDLPALAAALTRAQATGYDIGANLPRLVAQAPLPSWHPLRELHERLLVDCPAVLLTTTPMPGRSPAQAEADLPPGYRVDEAGTDESSFYLVTTRLGQVVGAPRDRDSAVDLAPFSA